MKTYLSSIDREYEIIVEKLLKIELKTHAQIAHLFFANTKANAKKQKNYFSDWKKNENIIKINIIIRKFVI